MLKLKEMQARHEAEIELLRAENAHLELIARNTKGLNIESGSSIEELQTNRIIKLEKENKELRMLNAELKDKFVKDTSPKLDKLSGLIEKLRKKQVDINNDIV